MLAYIPGHKTERMCIGVVLGQRDAFSMQFSIQYEKLNLKRWKGGKGNHDWLVFFFPCLFECQQPCIYFFQTKKFVQVTDHKLILVSAFEHTYKAFSKLIKQINKRKQRNKKKNPLEGYSIWCKRIIKCFMPAQQ